MATSNSKQRLFEVMGKVNKTFKPRLNEEIGGSDIDNIVNSYLETALWAEGGDGHELDNKSIYDIDKNSVEKSKQDIMKFIQLAQQQAPEELTQYNAESLGHNIWLSRNGHGAGFFDDNNDQLQDIARDLKQADIYVGDDGKVYIGGAEPMNEKIIGKKPTRKSDDVSYYKGEGAFPGYTHFAVVKADTPFEGQMLPTANKIVNGWDYRGEDSEDLKADKQHYFTQDIKDMDIKPSSVQIVATAYLKKRGIDPYTYDNWLGNELMGKFVQSQY